MNTEPVGSIEGVPLERSPSVGGSLLVPVSPTLAKQLAAGWSEPVQVCISSSGDGLVELTARVLDDRALLKPIALNYWTGDHFSSQMVGPGETVRVPLDGVVLEVGYHREPWSCDGDERSSLGLKVMERPSLWTRLRRKAGRT